MEAFLFATLKKAKIITSAGILMLTVIWDRRGIILIDPFLGGTFYQRVLIKCCTVKCKAHHKSSYISPDKGHPLHEEVWMKKGTRLTRGKTWLGWVDNVVQSAWFNLWRTDSCICELSAIISGNYHTFKSPYHGQSVAAISKVQRTITPLGCHYRLHRCIGHP